MITRISAYIMPLVILIIVGYGLYKKSDNYDNFIKGAADGMKTVVDIAPTLVGLMVAVGVLRYYTTCHSEAVQLIGGDRSES